MDSKAETCEEVAAFCVCNKAKDHVKNGDPVHECEDTVNCNGAWEGDFRPDNTEFRIIRFPGLV